MTKREKIEYIATNIAKKPEYIPDLKVLIARLDGQALNRLYKDVKAHIDDWQKDFHIWRTETQLFK